MNPTRWRLLKGRDLTSARGLAIDESLAILLAKRRSPPALHLYRFRPSVILGRYQDPGGALDLDACSRLGFEVNRRRTGGGTVIMGPDQVALGFAVPFAHPALEGTVESAFESMSRMTLAALMDLGVRASFRPKNDLEVDGKKLAGMAASLEEEGVFFFHMSLLLDFDIEVMVDLLRVYPEKRATRAVGCFQRRMTTVKAEAGWPVSFEEASQALLKAYSEGFDVEIVPSELSPEETAEVEKLERDRYTRKSWIWAHKAARPAHGVHRVRTKGGVLEVRVWLAGSALERVLLLGDYFACSMDVARIETALKWIPARQDSVSDAIRKAMPQGSLHLITSDQLCEAVVQSCRNAGSRPDRARIGSVP